MQKNVGFSNTTESNYKNLEARINGVLIPTNSILDIQITFGGVRKIGNISFVDNNNILEVALSNMGSITISYIDFNDSQYLEIFVIKNVNKSIDKSNKQFVNLLFEDQQSNSLKNIYSNLVYKDKSAIEILANISDIYELGFKCYGTNESPKFENVVIPTNISLWDWIIQFSEKHNIVLFRDKYSSYVYEKALLDYSLLLDSPEIAFNTMDNDKSYRRIMEYNLKTYDKNSLDYVTNYSSMSFDVDNSVIKPEIVLRDEVYQNQKINELNGFNESIFSSNMAGLQSFSPSLLTNYNDNRFKISINSNQEGKLIIGGINIDRMYQKVKLNISRNNTSENLDELTTGNYIIVGSVDKIIKGLFVNQILVQRSDYKRREDLK